ncbi:NADPH--cytochrome P450 reductase [Hondaea fermentalgiana]|uniref:Methionine synthase reductase n=1 Tax=Hondaea fermentalgiana TaxID=2315210 RepID=A0A2R5G9F5_9STRA|nr:NADPH--cytochrome P450 reductase [Hondaea fermentalgiana]|eukprot:GBG27660.1 NADPH--cytochrome P450 reductase [Hondaea fermentalgiana]
MSDKTNVLILYGSETGNAESIAEGLYEASGENGFAGVLAPLDDYKKVGFESASLVLIVTSTTGNGEPPRNADKFYRFLRRRSHPDGFLADKSFAVLGLGDTNYDQFCWVAKRVDARMEQLGAKRILPLACADEGTDLEKTVEPWRLGIWDVLRAYLAEGPAPVDNGNNNANVSQEDAGNASGEPSGASRAEESARAKAPKGSPSAPTASPTPTSESSQLPVASASAAQTATPRGEDSAETSHGPTKDMLIMYGSETGNAEAIATDLHGKASAHGFNSRLAEMNAFKECKLVEQELALFVVSTTGNGEPPRNADACWRFLRRRTQPQDLLQGMQYAVLALGDTNYDQFCHAGKRVDKRLAELGAARILNVACADEGTGLEQVVEPWKVNIWEALAAKVSGAKAGPADENLSRQSIAEDSTQAAASSEASPTVSHAESKEPAKSIGVEQENNFRGASSTTKADAKTATTVEPGRFRNEVFVMYGSETGNGEAIAERVFEQLNAAQTPAKLAPMNDYKKVGLLDAREAIFIVSSTGNGDPPRNAESMMRFIRRRSHPENLLQHLRYAILALGDTNYDNFCATGASLERRLTQLGATRWLDMVRADEAVGLDEFVEPWIEKVLSRSGPSDGGSKKEEPASNSLASSTRLASGSSKATSVQKSTSETKTLADTNPTHDASTGSAARSTIVQPTGLPVKLAAASPKPVAVTTTKLKSATPSQSGADTTTTGWREAGPPMTFEDVCSLCSVEELEKNTVRPGNLDACLARVRVVSSEPTRKNSVSSLGSGSSATSGQIADTGGANENRPRIRSFASMDSPGSVAGSSASNPIDADLVEAEYMSKGEDVKRVLRVSLELKFPEFPAQWSPGDALGVICPNPDVLVSKVLGRLGLDGKTQVEVTTRARGPAGSAATAGASQAQERPLFSNLDPVTSVEQIFTWGVDMTSTPRKSFFRMLSEHCSDPLDRARLRYLSSLKGRSVFVKLIEAQQLTLLEVLELFPSCSPPLESLLHGLPKLAPRFYSVANSPLGSQGYRRVTLAMTVVETEMLGRDGRQRVVHGLCTSWMEGLARKLSQQRQGQGQGGAGGATALPGARPTRALDAVLRKVGRAPPARPNLPPPPPRVQVFFRSSSAFHLPGNVEIPLIMIGPGTGVAPFVGFIEHRRHLKTAQVAVKGDLYEGHWRGGHAVHAEDLAATLEFEPEQQLKAEVEPSHLYYGCRYEDRDFLFKDFLEREAKAGDVLGCLRCAFSREGADKVYVQHLLRADGAAVAERILRREGFIYVCGDGMAMAKDVHQALIDILVQHGRLSKVEAQAKLEELAQRGRYKRDIWS